MSHGESCRFKVVMFEVEEEQKLRVRVTARADERAATLRAPWYRWSNHEDLRCSAKAQKWVGLAACKSIGLTFYIRLAAHMPL